MQLKCAIEVVLSIVFSVKLFKTQIPRYIITVVLYELYIFTRMFFLSQFIMELENDLYKWSSIYTKRQNSQYILFKLVGVSIGTHVNMFVVGNNYC